MNSKTKRAALERALGLALIGGSICNIAQAQEASPGLEEIVVTGERIARGIKETASSVNVTTAEDLARQGAPEKIEDVIALIPNVTIGASDSGPAIRGQDATGLLTAVNAFLGGSRSRTTIQVDGRALSYNELIYGLNGVWDLQRIEVFRGPQTTTQGRNSIAGAIFIETREPTFDPELRAQVSAGNYDSRRASVAASGPLVDDQLAGRISADYRTSEQEIRWLNVTEALIGIDPNEEKQSQVRGRLLWTPSGAPDLRSELIFAHSESTGRQVQAADRPFTTRVDSNMNRAIFVNRSDSAVLRSMYDVTPDLNISATLTAADIDTRRYVRRGAGTVTVGLKEYSLESILRWSPSSSVTLLSGIYALSSEANERSDFSAFGTGFGNFNDEQLSLGMFAEGTWKPVDRLSLTAGGRWQRDRQDRDGALGIFVVDFDETYEQFLPKAGIAYDLTPEVRIGATAQQGFNPGGTTISFTTGEQDRFDAEKVWSYEVYARASFNQVRLSANAFYTDFEDAQRSLTTEENGVFLTTFSNAPKARSYGLELSADWQVTRAVSLQAALGVLDTRIEETVVPTDPINGKEFQRSPHLTGALAFGYEPIEGLRFDANARYSDGYFSDDLNAPALKVDSVVLADANVSYTYSHYKVFGYVRNLFDEFHISAYYTANSATVIEPRQYGIGVEVNF